MSHRKTDLWLQNYFRENRLFFSILPTKAKLVVSSDFQEHVLSLREIEFDRSNPQFTWLHKERVVELVEQDEEYSSFRLSTVTKWFLWRVEAVYIKGDIVSKGDVTVTNIKIANGAINYVFLSILLIGQIYLIGETILKYCCLPQDWQNSFWTTVILLPLVSIVIYMMRTNKVILLKDFLKHIELKPSK